MEPSDAMIELMLVFEHRPQQLDQALQKQPQAISRLWEKLLNQDLKHLTPGSLEASEQVTLDERRQRRAARVWNSLTDASQGLLMEWLETAGGFRGPIEAWEPQPIPLGTAAV